MDTILGFELYGVVNSFMAIAQRYQIVIAFPTIRPNNRAPFNIPGNNTVQGFFIPYFRENLKILPFESIPPTNQIF